MADCIFCKIAAGEIPAKVVYQNDRVIAFRDINPQAPVHIVVIPKRHLEWGDLQGADWNEIGALGEASAAIARQEGIAGGGFRVVMNSGHDAGQTVDHIHMHLLGGRHMAWPPG